MPAFEIMFPRLITALQDEEILDQLRENLAAEMSLVEIVNELGLVESQGQADFIAQTPPALQVAILAVVRENLARDEPKQMMFTWEAGYDWELRVRESTSSSISEGGITVHVASRYPDDPHPGQSPL
jgi:hypothetical protein